MILEINSSKVNVTHFYAGSDSTRDEPAEPWEVEFETDDESINEEMVYQAVLEYREEQRNE